MVAELLVGYRRIVGRGLQRVRGKDWFNTGCPVEVRKRILARREAEQGVDRFAADTDDPFAYATFADLAELVESVAELADLLRHLAGSPEQLITNLRALEELRTKIAAMRRISEQELNELTEMHLRVREKLAGARRKAKDAQASGGSPDADAAAVTLQTTGELDEPEPGPLPSQTVSTVEPSDRSAPGSVTPDDEQQPPPARPADRRSGLAAAPSVEEGREPPHESIERAGFASLDGAPTPVGLVHVDGGDLGVLRDLRREIIAAAEAAYAHSDEIVISVWTEAWESGWFSGKIERYGLSDVATFYAVMEQYLRQRQAGCDKAALKTFLADRELAKVLLRLRELFLRLRV